MDEPGGIRLRETGQKGKDQDGLVSLNCGISRKTKKSFIETESRKVVTRGSGVGK